MVIMTTLTLLSLNDQDSREDQVRDESLYSTQCDKLVDNGVSSRHGRCAMYYGKQFGRFTVDSVTFISRLVVLGRNLGLCFTIVDLRFTMMQEPRPGVRSVEAAKRAGEGGEKGCVAW